MSIIWDISNRPTPHKGAFGTAHGALVSIALLLFAGLSKIVLSLSYFRFEVQCTYQAVVSAHVRAHILSGMISDEPYRPRSQQNDPRGPPTAHLSIAFKSTHWVRAHVASHSVMVISKSHPPMEHITFCLHFAVVISHLCLPIDHVAVCSWSSDSHNHPPLIHLSSMSHFVHG